MLRRVIGPALVAGAILLAPGSAQANHHACPQVTTIPNDDGTTTINVAREGPIFLGAPLA